jgi:DNA-binding YbaB/EbfC family protein
MSGTFGDMGNLLKQAQEMHKQLEKAREELRKATVEGSAGGGAVKVTVNGEGMLTRLNLQRELASSGNAALIEETVLAAVRDGLTKAAAMREERLSRISGGLSLPGLF